MLLFSFAVFTVALNFEDRMVFFAASMPDMAKINWIEFNLETWKECQRQTSKFNNFVYQNEKNKYNTYNLQMAGWGDVLATMIGFNDDFFKVRATSMLFQSIKLFHISE